MRVSRAGFLLLLWQHLSCIPVFQLWPWSLAHIWEGNCGMGLFFLCLPLKINTAKHSEHAFASERQVGRRQQLLRAADCYLQIAQCRCAASPPTTTLPKFPRPRARKGISPSYCQSGADTAQPIHTALLSNSHSLFLFCFFN